MDKKKFKLIKECEICKSDALYICFECKSYFCESCFKFIHDKKKNSKHIKQNIDPFIPIDIKCTEHPDHPLSLFCIDEKGKK